LQVSVNATVAAMVFYAFLFLTLMARPQGLMGGRLAERY
jgi:branched-chain amino acid transport system permease protein